MNWNFSEALQLTAQSPLGQRPALIHDDEVISFVTLAERSSAIASWLANLGLDRGAHIGHYMRNSNAYMETFYASGLAGLSHVNVNYRYRDDELRDLANGLDLRVLFYDAEFADIVARIKAQCPQLVAYVEVGAQTPANEFAQDFRALYEVDSSEFQRCTSPDDLVVIATGGTTGLPKGTQWRHEDLWFKMETSCGRAMAALQLETHPSSVAEHVTNVGRLPQAGPMLPLSPLMHGTGLLIAVNTLAQGNPICTLSGAHFDAGRTIDAIVKHNISGMVIVGDAFALPLVDELKRRQSMVDGSASPLASINMLFSSGALLSEENSAALQSHNPNMLIIDALGSTESIGFGMATGETGVFAPMPTTRVFDDDGRPVEPGSDTIGIAYSGGPQPIGYYKEPDKTAETFVEIDGERYVKTGDRCTVRADGMLVLLGRDSTVINTGGEKVYTVEVERVLVAHSAIDDAIVLGLPHPRFGKMVVAVIEGATLDQATLDMQAIKDFVRSSLADYKVPKQITLIDSMRRAPNGKPDYPFLESYAAQQLASVAQS